MSTIKLQEFAFHTGSAASCNPKQVYYQMLPSAQSSTDQLMAKRRNNVKLVFFPDAYYTQLSLNTSVPDPVFFFHQQHFVHLDSIK